MSEKHTGTLQRLKIQAGLRCCMLSIFNQILSFWWIKYISVPLQSMQPDLPFANPNKFFLYL